MCFCQWVFFFLVPPLLVRQKVHFSVSMCLSRIGDHPCPRSSVVDPTGKGSVVNVRHTEQWHCLVFLKSHHKWTTGHIVKYSYKQPPLKSIGDLITENNAQVKLELIWP